MKISSALFDLMARPATAALIVLVTAIAASGVNSAIISMFGN